MVSVWRSLAKQGFACACVCRGDVEVECWRCRQVRAWEARDSEAGFWLRVVEAGEAGVRRRQAAEREAEEDEAWRLRQLREWAERCACGEEGKGECRE